MGLNEAQKKERSEYLEHNLEITECSQRKPYVFISYASDNWETVFKSVVVPMQKQYGLRVYADKAFDKVNDKWIVPMLRNIRGADVIIAFVSQSYVESYACFLELLTAVNNRKQIVFVSLEDRLRLGDTTDQPVVERGVKNEILNQGANIATNTNNTSNDLMRAMKSAFTSLSTLLEQDALSKYDISDAFINFFRDASINRKTINDLNAVRGTIESVSRSVFDRSLITVQENAGTEWKKSIFPAREQPVRETETVHQQPAQPAESVHQQPVQPAETVYQQPVQPTESVHQQPAQPAETVYQQPVRSAEAAYQQPAQPAESVHQQPVQRTETTYQPTEAAYQKPLQSAENAYQQPVQQAEAGWQEPQQGQAPANAKKPKFDIRNKKKLAIVAGVCLLLVIIIVKIVSPKTVKNMVYTISEGYSGTYTGEWKNDQPDGEGKIQWDNGNVYEGEWENGMPNGQGTCRYSNGDVYTGEWVNDFITGKGTMKYANGEVYEGEWNQGYCEGQGTLTKANGDVYSGKWVQSKLNGQGTATYANGDKYTGEWLNGSYHGYGTGEFANGSKYEGEWKNGSANGQGTSWNTNGAIYTGEWVDGLPNGYGLIKWANGDTYEGEWKDDKLHGQGTYTFADGTVQTGTWEDGQYVG